VGEGRLDRFRTGTAPYLCNLVGSSFGPCANNIGFTGAGAEYPINFFQANPYAQSFNGPESYTVAEGYSNYNALQYNIQALTSFFSVVFLRLAPDTRTFNEGAHGDIKQFFT